MVAFIVNVKLVENNVNKKVGVVIVVNVISQYSMPGMILMMNRIILPDIRNQESVGDSPVRTTGVVARAVAEIVVEFMLVGKLVTL